MSKIKQITMTEIQNSKLMILKKEGQICLAPINLFRVFYGRKI